MSKQSDMRGAIRGPKDKHPGLYRAAQADARNYPGGVGALCEQIGRNYNTFRAGICPTNPVVELTLDALMDIIEHTGGVQTVQYIARLGNQTALPNPAAHGGSPTEVFSAFMGVVREAGRVNERSAEALEDHRLDAQERVDIGNLLDTLIAVAVEYRAIVRG